MGRQTNAENEISFKRTPKTVAALVGGSAYDFILQAVNGDKATADVIFEDYLAGKLSEELLSISRRWVSADQAGSSKGEIERNGAVQRQLREHAAGGVGVGDEAFTAVA